MNGTSTVPVFANEFFLLHHPIQEKLIKNLMTQSLHGSIIENVPDVHRL